MSKKSGRHVRQITVSICHPVTVVLLVCTDENPDEHADWQVEHIVHSSCEVTPRSFAESANDDDFAALYLRASHATDIK